MKNHKNISWDNMKSLFYLIAIIICVFSVNNLLAKSIYDYSFFPEKDVTKFLDKYVQSFGADLNIQTQMEINASANWFIKVYNTFLETYIQNYTDKEKKVLFKNFEIALQKIINNKDINYKQSPSKTMDRLLTDVYKQVDEHTFILFADDLKEFYMDISSHQLGIPISFSVGLEGDIIITNIYSNEVIKAGIKPNDKLIAINDMLIPSKKNYKGRYIDKQHYTKLKKVINFWNKITKENNASVKLTIENQGGKKDIILKNSEYVIPSVSSMVIDNKYLYINIYSFIEQDVFPQFKQVLKDNDVNKLKGLIIDLRDNGGGVLNYSAAIVNTMLSNKQFIHMKKNNNKSMEGLGGIQYSNVETITTSSDVIVNENIPIIILINSHTASASEFLAGALALNNRAILIGENTYGKWVSQYIDYIATDVLFAITNSAVYLENDITFQGEGIAPDIFIKSKEIIFKEKEKDSPNYIKLSNNKRTPKLELHEEVCPIIKNKITFNDEDRVLGCAKLFFESNYNIENFSEIISPNKTR